MNAAIGDRIAAMQVEHGYERYRGLPGTVKKLFYVNGRQKVVIAYEPAPSPYGDWMATPWPFEIFSDLCEPVSADEPETPVEAPVIPVGRDRDPETLADRRTPQQRETILSIAASPEFAWALSNPCSEAVSVDYTGPFNFAWYATDGVLHATRIGKRGNIIGHVTSAGSPPAAVPAGIADGITRKRATAAGRKGARRWELYRAGEWIGDLVSWPEGTWEFQPATMLDGEQIISGRSEAEVLLRSGLLK